MKLAARHPLLFILLLGWVLGGCQSAAPTKPAEQTAALNYTAYLYSLYDTESTRPRESLKEDRLNLKPSATLVVARLGEYAPRESLLQQLRAQTNLFKRVVAIPAVLEIATGSQAQSPPKPSEEIIKDHVVKMRQLAADLGGNYLYLVGGVLRASSAQEYTGVLDLTIIGSYFVGSHRIDVDARGSAALVDVASGRVLSVVTEQSQQVTHAPTAFLDDRKKRDTEFADARLEESLTRKLIVQIENRK